MPIWLYAATRISCIVTQSGLNNEIQSFHSVKITHGHFFKAILNMTACNAQTFSAVVGLATAEKTSYFTHL